MLAAEPHAWLSDPHKAPPQFLHIRAKSSGEAVNHDVVIGRSQLKKPSGVILKRRLLMIFERRAYAVKPGMLNNYWQLMDDYGHADSMHDILGHLVGFFETVAQPVGRLVHLYRFDNLDQWDETHRAVNQNHSPEYFVRARAILQAQENTFLRPSPLPELQPGSDGFVNPVAEPSADPVVVETRIDLEPGAIVDFWQGLRKLRDEQGDGWWQGRIGTYSSISGQLHRVYDYQWYDSMQAYGAWQQNAPEAAAYVDLIRSTSRLAGGAATLLRPSPLPLLRKLFPRENA